MLNCLIACNKITLNRRLFVNPNNLIAFHDGIHNADAIIQSQLLIC